MNAFVGHSFDKKDEAVVRKIITFLKAAGLECETGEPAENKSIASQVKGKISKNDVFVGIFTRDRVICGGKGMIAPLSKRRRQYTTSNWVIQEAGFAMGKEKELVLMVEDRVHKFPELQGDMEVIRFSRKSFDEPFLKLSEMIRSIRARKSDAVSGEARGKPEDFEKQEEERQKQKDEAVVKSKEQEAFGKLFEAMKEEDSDKVKELWDKELEPILAGDKKQMWKAVVLRLRHKYGDSDAFHELQGYCEDNKHNPDVLWQLALRYKEMREYEVAKGKFLVIKSLYDLSKKEDRKKMIDCCEQASFCAAFDDKYEEAIRLLSELLSEGTLKEYKSRTLTGLANIAKRKKDLERFFTYAEGSLNLDPTDADLRFDLAYRYSLNGHDKLSLLHYKKLVDIQKSRGGLNNLGVLYETLKLSARSIESYSQAANCNETLAMANMAHRYLKEGFIENARKQINRANELCGPGIEVHGNVGEAKNKLVKMLEEEEDKEKDILREADQERKFRVRYSEAFVCGTEIVAENLEGVWETRWGSLHVTFDECSKSFKVDEKKETTAPRMLPLISKESVVGTQDSKIRYVKIEGKVENLSVRYTIEVEEPAEYDFLAPDTKKVFEAEGYMVINEGCRSLDVMEKTKDEKLTMDTWRRSPNT